MTWQFFAIGSAFFASLTAIFGKIGVSDLPSNLATFIRTVFIAILCGAVVIVRKEWSHSISRHALLFLFLSAIATGLSWLCYYRALQMGDASKVAPVDKLSVVFVILLAAVFLHEPLRWQTMLGSILIFAGSLVLIFT